MCHHIRVTFGPLHLTALLAPLVALLAGCASLDRDECRNANWYAIGLEDGARGRALDRLGDHRRACAEHGVSIDADRYVTGRNEGLNTFCTFQNGYSQGRAGHAYAGACPSDTAKLFLAGHQRGRELYELHRRHENLEREINRIKTALREGIPNPRTRAQEVERLEVTTREAEQVAELIRRLETR